jgi:hypothetical protein
MVAYIIVNRRTLRFRQQFLGIDCEAPRGHDEHDGELRKMPEITGSS